MAMARKGERAGGSSAGDPQHESSAVLVAQDRPARAQRPAVPTGHAAAVADVGGHALPARHHADEGPDALHLAHPALGRRGGVRLRDPRVAPSAGERRDGNRGEHEATMVSDPMPDSGRGRSVPRGMPSNRLGRPATPQSRSRIEADRSRRPLDRQGERCLACSPSLVGQWHFQPAALPALPTRRAWPETGRFHGGLSLPGGRQLAVVICQVLDCRFEGSPRPAFWGGAIARAEPSAPGVQTSSVGLGRWHGQSSRRRSLRPEARLSRRANQRADEEEPLSPFY